LTQLLASSARTDTVSALLRDLRVRSTVYCRSDFTAPWGFGVRARELGSFHVVVAGDCWLEVEGEPEPRRVEAGDLVILPRGEVHRLRDRPGSPIRWLEELLEHPVDQELRMGCGGGGASTRLLCGAYALEGSRHHPALSILPTVVHVRGRSGHPPPWLAATLELIAAETGAGGAGAAVVCERLSEVMLAQALRIALLDLNDEGVGLAALRDAGIAPAVQAIHERPEHPWTLGELATLASMSGSAFSARFRAVTGDSPIRYVTRCRLMRAARRLRTGDASLAELAALAGYESEFSFGRAFKRAFGIAPGAFRDRERSAGKTPPVGAGARTDRSAEP